MKAVGKSSWEGKGPGCPGRGPGWLGWYIGKYITYLLRGILGYIGVYIRKLFFTLVRINGERISG